MLRHYKARARGIKRGIKMPQYETEMVKDRLKRLRVACGYSGEGAAG